LLRLQTFGGDLSGGRGQAEPLKSEWFYLNSDANTNFSGMSPNEEVS